MKTAKNTVSFLLILAFISIAGSKTVLALSKDSESVKFVFSEIEEIEESNKTESSGEEDEDEINIDSHSCIDSFIYYLYDFSNVGLGFANRHFYPSEYSANIFSPPEII